MRRRKDAADEAHDSSQSLDTSEDEVAYVEGYLLEMTVTGPKVCERRVGVLAQDPAGTVRLLLS